MNVGIVVLIVMASVLLGQAFVQGQEHRRRHAEIIHRLAELAGRNGG